MYKLTIPALLLLSLTSCQNETSNANTANVSTQQYKNYSCKQITKEMQRISRQLDNSTKRDLAGNVLNSAMAIYYVSQGYGVGGSGDDNSETNRLQAQYNALEQLSIEKNCD